MSVVGMISAAFGHLVHRAGLGLHVITHSVL
jgi:hypothetical protein